MRIALLVNPKSGSAPDPNRLLDGLAREGTEIQRFSLDEREQIPAWHPDRVVVAGGDGSLGCGLEAAHQAGASLAVIPSGTANDFAHAMGLPLELDAALAVAGDPSAPTDEIWGGCVAGRAFVNVASVGLAVDAAEFAEHYKGRFGPAAYALGAVRAGARAHPVRVEVRTAEGLVQSGRVWQLLIGATGRFGGGAGLGHADPHERRLAAASIRAGSRLTLPIRAIGLRRRELERQSGVRWGYSARLQVSATAGGRPVTWNLDGELWQPPEESVTIEPLGPVALVGADLQQPT